MKHMKSVRNVYFNSKSSRSIM